MNKNHPYVTPRCEKMLHFVHSDKCFNGIGTCDNFAASSNCFVVHKPQMRSHSVAPEIKQKVWKDEPAINTKKAERKNHLKKLSEDWII